MNISEQTLLFGTLGSLVLSSVVYHYAEDDYSGLLSIVGIMVNSLLIVLMSLPVLIPVPNPLFTEPLVITNLYPVFLLGLSLSIISAISLFKISLLSQIKGDRLLLRDEPVAVFNEDILSAECYNNASRVSEFYLNYREGNSQYIFPIENLEELTEILEKDSTPENPITCCRCENLKPRFIGTAHIQDFSEASWDPICKDCTMELLNTAIDQEDNYLSEELILSQTI